MRDLIWSSCQAEGSLYHRSHKKTEEDFPEATESGKARVVFELSSHTRCRLSCACYSMGQLVLMNWAPTAFCLITAVSGESSQQGQARPVSASSPRCCLLSPTPKLHLEKE